MDFRVGRLTLTLTAVAALAACQMKLGGARPDAGPVVTDVPGNAVVGAPAGQARDVEAPEVFAKTDKALWDGRPSLGGIWVAHTSVKDPERVVMRNKANGRSIAGALFRREFDSAGPSLQLSSDAAEALGILAGQPTVIEVVALKRVEAAPPPVAEVAATAASAPPPKPGTKPAQKPGAETPAATPKPAKGEPAAAKPAATKPAAGGISAKPIDPVAATAAAAIDKATAKGTAKPAPAAPAPSAASAAAPTKAFVQIGIFSTEANAQTAAKQLGTIGLAAQVKENKGETKTLWRVLVGPAATVGDRDALIAKVKGLGYPDAYAVSK